MTFDLDVWLRPWHYLGQGHTQSSPSREENVAIAVGATLGEGSLAVVVVSRINCGLPSFDLPCLHHRFFLSRPFVALLFTFIQSPYKTATERQRKRFTGR